MTAPLSPAPQHRQAAARPVACAVLTVSDTRTLETDRGGALLAELLTAGGHRVVERQIVPDEPEAIATLVRQWTDDRGSESPIEAVLLTGGTGISPRDQTYETVCNLLTQTLPGYGELFRMLSYEQIGAAAMLSRAVGGLRHQTVILSMPGSTAAVQLAAEKIIVPELAHLVHEARK